MSDYFEVEAAVKEYDARIMARILSYLKPYRRLAALTILALALSTLGELFVPVMQQRLVDGAILSRFIAVKLDTDDSVQLSEAAELEYSRLLDREGVEAGGYRFIPLGRNLRLSGAVEKELSAGGIILAGNWYAFTLDGGPGKAAVADVVAAHPDLFLTAADGSAAAIRNDDLYGALSPAEITAIRGRDIAAIIRTVLFLLAILASVFVFTFLQTWSTTLIGQKVMKDIRLALFEKTLSQSTDFLSRHPVGRIVTRLTGDVETINDFFSNVLVAFLKDLSVMAGVLVTMFILSPALALVVVCMLPPVLAITAVSRIRARDAFRRQRTAQSRVNSYLSEHLSGVQVVQLFLGEGKSRREFAERNRELLRANLGEMFVFATFRPAVEWLSTVTTAAVITVGANLVLGLSLSLGVMIAFISLVSMFFNPVMDIAEKYTLLQSAMAGGERVFALLDTDERIPETTKEQALTTNLANHTDEMKKQTTNLTNHTDGGMQCSGLIEFKDVRFSYKKGEEVLKGLTFTVRPGEMAAIVGYTGAGKTTIINVLTRLWDLDSGQILLDGKPIRELPLASLRRAALPVLQDVFLFSLTVADNIRLGLPLTDAEVEEAAKAVHAHEFIRALPDGYATMLSEGAANISSGQRQLISFARVIAHDPAIVILDEATSSIDTETERLVQLGMRRVLQGRSSIVIAHRLSTIRHADRILVLQGGRLVEEGRHDALIAAGGLYASLYRLQYQDE